MQLNNVSLNNNNLLQTMLTRPDKTFLLEQFQIQLPFFSSGILTFFFLICTVLFVKMLVLSFLFIYFVIIPVEIHLFINIMCNKSFLEKICFDFKETNTVLPVTIVLNFRYRNYFIYHWLYQQCNVLCLCNHHMSTDSSFCTCQTSTYCLVLTLFSWLYQQCNVFVSL